MLLFHGNNLIIRGDYELASVIQDMWWRASYLIDPQYPSIECGALIFLEKLQIDVHEVGSLERLHHTQQDVDVAR